MREKQRGVGLVELIVVVAIILIVVGFAVPSFLTTVESYRLESAASTIASKLLDARINAIKLNRQAWLEIDAAASRVYVQIDDPDNPGTDLDVGNPEFIHASLALVSPTPTQVTFDSLGRTASPQTIALRVRRTGQQKTVTISATGRTTVN